MRTTLLIICLTLAACGSRYEQVDPETGIPILPRPELGVQQAGLSAGPALKRTGCHQLESIFRAQAILEMAERLQVHFNSDWKAREQCNKGYWGGYADAGVALPAADSGSTAPVDPGDPEHSETNNQVQGVDEADFVKTDGKHIFIVSGGAFRVLASWPADQTRELSKVAVEGTPRSLFVHEDRVLIYSSLPGGSSNHGGGSGDCTYGYTCVPRGDGHPTKITVLSISDRSNPRVLRELTLSSSLLRARRIGAAVQTVLTSSPVNFPGLRYYPDHLDICDMSHYQIYLAYTSLMKTNIALINGTKLPDLFPRARDKIHQDSKTFENKSPFEGCQNFYRASINDGRQFTSVLSLRMDSTKAASAATIISKPGVVYASKEALYLAVPRLRNDAWGWFEGLSDAQEATAVHKFQMQDATATYVASGLVKGRILNQFSLDEHDGFLRLASTTGRVGWQTQVHNTLTVLEQQGTALEPKGVLDHLAPTEDIRSVRFDGKRGYVVTFKKTDPLFVLDLARPDKPEVLGELKIPGFSTYMHRMDADHLLTIGYGSDDQSSFAWFTSVMLQIFDVTDPTRPKLKHKHVIGTRGSSSEALENHLAFTYFAPKDLLSLPMTVCEGGSGGGSYGMDMTFSGLMVFDVTAQSGFSLRGKVPHPMGAGATCGNWWTSAGSVVKRSIIIGDYVYSISDELLKVNALSDLGTDLVSLSLL